MNTLDSYQLTVNNILVDVVIYENEKEPVPIYSISLTNISDTTKIVLEKIRQEFISKVDLEDIEDAEENKITDIKDRFVKEIQSLLKKYFPAIDKQTEDMLINYIIEENLGLGKIEILLKDPMIEEIVVNNHEEPVWIYHRKHAWLKTNIRILTESKIRHFSTMIGRDVGKEITNLNPLMDARLFTGDRVNATLNPISSRGNTITIRKFAKDPWTITKFIRSGAITFDAAALIWLSIQHELSVIIAGGTGSGKTSMLNVVSNFFPPNQRILSIEDTRELVLSNTLHWVPMETRLANPEGKGEVTMLDLLVNALRMRPDRIIVGEIRRQKEAQTLLEAVHTGHSVYATIHANTAEEVIARLCNPPIDIPKPMISALSLIVVQNRNRRTGKRNTMQIAEVTSTGDARVLLQHDFSRDLLVKVQDSQSLMNKLQMYTGLSREKIVKDLEEKVKILKWLLLNNVEDVHKIGLIMSKYYRGKLDIDLSNV